MGIRIEFNHATLEISSSTWSNTVTSTSQIITVSGNYKLLAVIGVLSLLFVILAIFLLVKCCRKRRRSQVQQVASIPIRHTSNSENVIVDLASTSVQPISASNVAPVTLPAPPAPIAAFNRKQK